MSAFVVTNAHIDVLVNALAGASVIDRSAGAKRFRTVGQVLWDENYRSVNFRYNETTEVPGYVLHTTEGKLRPTAVLSAVDCYEYQSCEHPEWGNCEANTLISDLRTAICAEHPGWGEPVQRGSWITYGYRLLGEYDREPWEFTSLDQAIALPSD